MVSSYRYITSVSVTVSEYNMVSSCRYVRSVSVSVSIRWCLPVEMLEVCL